MPLHTRGFKTLLPVGGDMWRSHAVDHESHDHPAPGCMQQRYRNVCACAHKVENVGFQQHLVLCASDLLDHGGEQLDAALQQMQLMARRKRCHGAFHRSKPNSAISGKWSDMRHQAGPCGTCAERGLRPRT